MHSYSSIIFVLSLTLLAGVFFINGCGEQAEEQQRQQFAKVRQGETPELAEYMQHIRRYTHKLSLSIEAQNGDLADFYMHELQASALAVKQDVPGYEGYDIAYFTELMFDPRVDSMRMALNSREWNRIDTELDKLVNSCNTCHNATGHGFINVTSGADKNPYNQVFELED